MSKLSKEEKHKRYLKKQSLKTIPKHKKIIKEGGYNSSIEKYWIPLFKEEYKKMEGKIPFIICIPPPNITGSLHIGHSMMIAIEDAIVRYKRLNGYKTLFLPGTDHAGIATQSLIIKKYKPKDKLEFLKLANEWTKGKKTCITTQFDRMGTSLNYDYLSFTLDPNIVKAVNKAFCILYKKGLIYRAQKVINWCSKLKTSISDLEVNYKSCTPNSKLFIEGKSYLFGVLYYFKYYITNKNYKNKPYVIVATTRPETILGDTAICINPKDIRFSTYDKIFEKDNICEDLGDKNFIIKKTETLNLLDEIKQEKKNKYKVNKHNINTDINNKLDLMAINPLTGNLIPVIFDEIADLSFGTGILKITPAHDFNDYLISKKHNLEILTILDENNCITLKNIKSNDKIACLEGMKRFDARLKVIELLGDNYIKSIGHEQVLPFCSRSNDIIEPMLKDQWWCKCETMAKRVKEGVINQEIKMNPVNADKKLFHWLDNIRDWCLSRQLWWGHSIPAYKCGDEWIVSETYEEALLLANGRPIQQDTDVLDTWFSSGLWPFATIGWPDKLDTNFYPNNLLETGSDILLFWVARMMMLGYELTDKPPFKEVLLHGLVRDAHGQKMSKSLGNVIDPLYVINGITLEEMKENLKLGNLDTRELKRAELALETDFPNGINKSGADALRFALLSYTNGMRDINLDINRVFGYSRLCNKLYNALNLILLKIDGKPNLKEYPHFNWIKQNLNNLIETSHKNYLNYNFLNLTQNLHSFFINNFCSIYLEIIKKDSFNCPILLKSLFSKILKLFNPIMPFISEELFNCLENKTLNLNSREILIKEYPKKYENVSSNDFNKLIKLGEELKNKSIYCKNNEYSYYLKILFKNTNIEYVDLLEGEECCGVIYKIK